MLHIQTKADLTFLCKFHSSTHTLGNGFNRRFKLTDHISLELTGKYSILTLQSSKQHVVGSILHIENF